MPNQVSANTYGTYQVVNMDTKGSHDEDFPDTENYIIEFEAARLEKKTIWRGSEEMEEPFKPEEAYVLYVKPHSKINVIGGTILGVDTGGNRGWLAGPDRFDSDIYGDWCINFFKGEVENTVDGTNYTACEIEVDGEYSTLYVVLDDQAAEYKGMAYTVNKINAHDDKVAVNITRNVGRSGYIIAAAYKDNGQLMDMAMEQLSIHGDVSMGEQVLRLNTLNCGCISVYIADSSGHFQPLSQKFTL